MSWIDCIVGDEAGSLCLMLQDGTHVRLTEQKVVGKQKQEEKPSLNLNGTRLQLIDTWD